MKLHEAKERLDVRKSDLSGSAFDDVNLSSCTVHNVNLSGASLDDVNMSGWRVNYVNLSGLRLSKANLAGASISESRYDGMTIDGVLVTEMIAAYKAGVPSNGQKFPDGSKIAKIQWIPKKSTEAPFDVNVPDTLKNVFLIEKDSARFPETGGWGYALFNYDAKTDTFAPEGSGTGCGHECHKAVVAKDYIFHPYQKR